MNQNKIFGACRDKLIVETIDKFRCLDAEQLQVLFFNATCNPVSAKRQCQNRCKILSDKRKLIQKWRMNLDEPYKYFIKDIDQKEHITLLNWMLIRLMLSMNYEKIYYMQYQRNYVVKIPDLFPVSYNSWDKERPYKAIFFEMDNTVTNKFDAVQKYNKLYESQPRDEFTALTAPHFPTIIIGTTDKVRLKEINNIIIKENKHNFNFKTCLIWDVKEECQNGKIENFSSKFIPSVHQLQQLSLR